MPDTKNINIENINITDGPQLAVDVLMKTGAYTRVLKQSLLGFALSMEDGEDKNDD